MPEKIDDPELLAEEGTPYCEVCDELDDGNCECYRRSREEREYED